MRASSPRTDMLANKASMTKRSASAEPWPTWYFATVGAIVGIFVVAISHFLHDHSMMRSSGEIQEHFLPQVVVGVVVGSLVFGGVAAVWNWLKRRA
jgi:H+/Cl- antiporter ClcA